MLANVTKKNPKNLNNNIYIHHFMYVEVGCIFCLLFECCYPLFFFFCWRIVILYYIYYLCCELLLYRCVFIFLGPITMFPFMCFGETIIVIDWCTAHAQLFNFGLFMFCWFFFCLFVTILMLVQKSMLCASEWFSLFSA